MVVITEFGFLSILKFDLNTKLCTHKQILIITLSEALVMHLKKYKISSLKSSNLQKKLHGRPNWKKNLRFLSHCFKLLNYNVFHHTNSKSVHSWNNQSKGMKMEKILHGMNHICACMLLPCRFRWLPVSTVYIAKINISFSKGIWN